MNLEVTNHNLYLFLPSKVSRVAAFIAEDKRCGIVEAIREFYASDTYKRMEKSLQIFIKHVPVFFIQPFFFEKRNITF